MIIRHTTQEDIKAALEATSNAYSGNIQLQKLEEHGIKSKWFSVRLGVYTSHGPGASFNHITGRRISAACWHVHGLFFDNLLTICPTAVIITGLSSKKIYMINNQIQNNWHDFNVGSMMYPLSASEKCKCNN